MSISALLDRGAYHNFIAAPQATKFEKSVHKSLLWSTGPMEVHLDENYWAISHQIVHLPIEFTYGAIYTVEFRVFPALNHALIMEMPFPHT